MKQNLDSNTQAMAHQLVQLSKKYSDESSASSQSSSQPNEEDQKESNSKPNEEEKNQNLPRTEGS